ESASPGVKGVRQPTWEVGGLLLSSPGVVRVLGEIPQEFEERWRLADEQPVGRQRGERAYGRAVRFRGPNDRTDREFSAQEWAGLRHDQAGFEILPAKRRSV